MGAIETIKEVVGLIQKVDNIDLYKRVLELQTQVVELSEENRILNEKLVTRDQLKFDKNAYWMNADGPFCSPCWDRDSKLIRLHVPSVGTAGSPQCPVCRHYAVDPAINRPFHQRAREGRTGTGPDEQPPRHRNRGGY